jgi:hypothetical protein
MAHQEFAHEPRNPEDFTGADAQYFETPPGAGYEHTDASVGTIVRFGIWLAVAALLVHVGLGLMYWLLIEQSKDLAQPRYPLAATGEAPQPPAPRLQQFPRTEMYEFRLNEDAQLKGYGWVSKDDGLVHIPIDEAMKKVLVIGLPSRASDAGQPAETPGLLASDPSSGRVMERRRQ